MIIENAFPQFQKQTETIDELLAFLNLIIRPTPGRVPYVKSGIISIPAAFAQDETQYNGSLAHEGKHQIKDPITFQNYVKGIHAIKDALNVDTERAANLANIASDLIIAGAMAGTPLGDYEGQAYLKLYRQSKDRCKGEARELMAAFAMIYNLKEIKADLACRTWKTIKKAIRYIDRVKAYVEIATAFHNLPPDPEPEDQKNQQKKKDQDEQKDEDQQQHDKDAGSPDDSDDKDEDESAEDHQQPGKDSDKDQSPEKTGEDKTGNSGEDTEEGDEDSEDSEDENQQEEPEKNEPLELSSAPISPDNEDLEEATTDALNEAKDQTDLKEKLDTLEDLAVLAGQSPGVIHELATDQAARLAAFYQARAQRTALMIHFPTTPTRSGTVLGSRKWTLTDGMANMDHKRTIQRSGRNIPLVTTRTPFIWNKIKVDKTTRTPKPLVVSCDASGSMGRPQGTMACTADRQTIAFFAILQAARRLNQSIGFTIWDDIIRAHEDPKAQNQFNQLARDFLAQYPGSGGTDVYPALEEMEAKPDQAFFLLTDGLVFHGMVSSSNPDIYDTIPEFYIAQLKKQGDKVHNCLVILHKPKDGEMSWTTAGRTQRIEYGAIVNGWISAFGADRVIVVEEEKDLPKIALAKWRDWFWN